MIDDCVFGVLDGPHLVATSRDRPDCHPADLITLERGNDREMGRSHEARLNLGDDTASETIRRSAFVSAAFNVFSALGGRYGLPPAGVAQAM